MNEFYRKMPKLLLHRHLESQVSVVRLGEREEMTPQEIDRIVCAWSMEFGIAMPEKALNALVDRLATISGPPGPSPEAH